MMKEAYVSYKIAKLLKEKGFNEETTHWYNVKESLINDYPVTYRNFSNPEKVWLAPTHQMACAWLREVHNIFILVGWNSIHEEYFTRILNMTDGIPKRNIHEHASYEEAIEEALKYCLENLL